MSNALTGDFDVVVEVAVPAIDRVLAAQHQAGTYLHSFSLRINDVPPTIRYIPHTSLRSAIAGTHMSATRFEAALPFPSHESGIERPPGEIGIREGVVRQATALEMGTEHAPSISSHETYVIPPQSRFTGVHGFAEIQISTPTITLPDDQSTTSVTIHYQLVVHFLSDPGSPAMPEFLHGELQATVDIDQVTWQAGNVIEIDFTKGDIEVTFQPFWADPPLSSQQEVMIEKIIHNALRTRFQPTNALLPGDIQQIRFKTLPDAIHPATALLLNLRQDAPVNVDPDSVTQGFLGDGDDFTIAVGRDYITSKIDETIGPIIRSFTPVVVYTIDLLFYSYDCYLHLDPRYTIDWLPGQIVLTNTGRVSTPPGFSDVYFSVKQAFHFDIENGSVILKPSGDPNLSIPGSGVAGWFARHGEGRATNQLRATRDHMLDKARPVIQKALDNSRNLGAILNALNISAQLNYTAVEIQPDGLLLRGTLSVPEWIPVHVESRSHLNVAQDGTVEVELTAFNSWIPGGTIQHYTWIVAGTARVEDHRFITRFPASNAPSQWCLNVQGTRITASGPPVEEKVKKAGSTHCWISRPGLGPNLADKRLTLILPGLPGPDPSPGLVAHIALTDANQAVASNTNTVVYFAGARVAAELSLLHRALLVSEKKDSAVFVVAVLPPGQSAAVEPMDLGANGAFALAENYKGGWGEVFEVNEVPALYLLNPQGQVLWRHVGQLRAANLTEAFDEHLVPGGRLRWQPLQLTVQQGEIALDFLFEYEPGRQLALRKLRGRPVLLNFWASWSQPSLDELRSLQKLYKASSSQEPIILAINDGESPELARRIFYQELGCTFQLVTDVSRQISRSYGVNCWPTTLSLDEKGIVRNSHFGLTPHEDMFADQKQSR